MVIFADWFGDFMFFLFIIVVVVCWAVTAATKKAVEVAKKAGEATKEVLKDPQVRTGIGIGLGIGRMNNWWR